MRASAAARAVIEYFEARRHEAYPDPATKGPPWTIGVGHTGQEVHSGLVWNDPQIDAAFDADIAEHEGHCQAALQGRQIPQHQFDALVCIMFNVGPGSEQKDGIARLKEGRPSTLVRRILVGDMHGAANQFLAWDKAAGKSMRGLRRRRAAERALFLGHTAEDAIAIGIATK